jgi:hypothetical protein
MAKTKVKNKPIKDDDPDPKDGKEAKDTKDMKDDDDTKFSKNKKGIEKINAVLDDGISAAQLDELPQSSMKVVDPEPPKPDQSLALDEEKNLIPVSMPAKDLDLVKIRSYAPSTFAADSSPLIKRPRYYRDIKIGDFKTYVDFVEARRDLIMRILDRFDGLPRNFPQGTPPTGRDIRIYDLAIAGSNVDALKHKLSAAAWDTLQDVFQQLNIDDAVTKAGVPIYQINGQVFQRNEESKLDEALQAVNMTYLQHASVMDLWMYYRNSNNQRTSMRGLPPTYNSEFELVAVDPRYMMQRFMVLKNPVLMHMIVSVWESFLAKTIAVPADGSTKTMIELLEVVEYSSTRMNMNYNLPREIKPSAADSYAMGVMLNWCVGTFYSRDYNIDGAAFEVGMLIDCLVKKALSPWGSLSQSAWLNVDNYLARWLLPALKGGANATVNQTYVPPTDVQFRANDVNYLKAAIEGGFFRNTASAVTVSNFLVGQGIDDVSTDVQVLPNERDYIFSGSRNWYVPFAGVATPSTDVVPARWEKYLQLVQVLQNGISNAGFPGGSSSNANIFKALLNYTSLFTERVSAMAFNIDQVMRQVSLIPGVFQYDPHGKSSLGGNYDYVRTDTNMVKGQALKFDALSALILIDWERAVSQFNLLESYKAGAYLNDWFNQLGDAIQIVNNRDYFDREKWHRGDRFREALKLIKNDHPIGSLVADSVGTTTVVNTLKFPELQDLPYSPYVDKMDIVFQFVQANYKDGSFGYVDTFYYAPSLVDYHTDAARDAVYQEGQYWLVDERNVPISHVFNDWQELVRAIQTQSINEILNDEDVRTNGYAVQFKFPIKLSDKDIKTGKPDSFQAFYYEPSLANLFVELKDVMFQYRWEDMKYFMLANDLAGSERPNYLAGTDGMFYGAAADVYAGMLRNYLTFRKEWVIANNKVEYFTIVNNY